MNIQITSDNVEISQSMKTLAQEKIERILQHLKGIPEDLKDIRIVLNKAPDETYESKVEVAISGKIYFADQLDHTLESSLIKAIEEIDRQLEKDRGIIEKDWEEQRQAKFVSEEDLSNETIQD